MKTFIKQISVLILSGILVFASGGFSLIHHYCGCSDNNNLSLMIEDESCHDNDVDQCCIVSIPDTKENCCDEQNNKAHRAHEQGGDKHNCCSSEYFYFKTDNFDLSGKKEITFDFIIAFVQEISTEKSQKNIPESLVHQINNDLPPPDYGIELLYSIHQLKIAYLLV